MLRWLDIALAIATRRVFSCLGCFMVTWHCWDTPHDLDVVLSLVRQGFRQIVFCHLFLCMSVLTSSFPSVHCFFYFFLASLGTVGNYRKIYALDVVWISSICLYSRQQSGQIWHHLLYHFPQTFSFSLSCLSLLFHLFLPRAVLQPCQCCLHAAVFSFVSSLLSGL